MESEMQALYSIAVVFQVVRLDSMMLDSTNLADPPVWLVTQKWHNQQNALHLVTASFGVPARMSNSSNKRPMCLPLARLLLLDVSLLKHPLSRERIRLGKLKASLLQEALQVF